MARVRYPFCNAKDVVNNGTCDWKLCEDSREVRQNGKCKMCMQPLVPDTTRTKCINCKDKNPKSAPNHEGMYIYGHASLLTL